MAPFRLVKTLNLISTYINKLKTLQHEKINISDQHLQLDKEITKELKENNLPMDTIQNLLHSLKKLHKIILNKLRIENRLHTQQKIHKAIQKNIDNLHNSPKRMIRNTLQHKNPQANFQKIIDPINDSVITDPQEIHSFIEEYYTKLYNNDTSTNTQTDIPSNWSSSYHPISSIKLEWYNNLLSEITTIEIQDTISNLPNNKAPGPSEISNDIIKKIVTPDLLNFLHLLYNKIISTKQIPSQWKTQNIYPISKKIEWKFNIQETRPISLIDSFRKIFTKILTNRLSIIFCSHKILQGNNFAGLPNQGTFQPLQILNSLYNTSKLKKEELWILSLDIKSAFDSINTKMLLKSMSRLKIPKDFLDLTENILTDRSCQVITSHGLTDYIPISQGIPQGETISPLWWVIFYDPLLTKLQQSHDKPHNLINNLAFMDDINLISPNKIILQSLLDTTTQFLSFNNISVNPQKTKLITINSKEKNKNIILNSTTILPNKKNDPIRILGIFLSESSIIKPGRDQIKKDITTISNSLKPKYTTGSMSTYIYNKVLLPRIEYKLQTTYLSPQQTIRFQQLIDTTIKHKFSIERSLPKKCFYNPNFFNIKTIQDLQKEVLISNFHYKLTDSFIQPFLNLELKTLQETNCIPTCILQNPIPLFSINTNTTSLKLSFDLNIKYCTPHSCNHTLPGGTTPLYTLIDKNWNRSAYQLYKLKLFYTEQITSYHNNNLIKWHHLAPITGSIRKGKIPQWYKILAQADINTPGLPIILQNPNRKWLATIQDNEIIIGKKQKKISSISTQINHQTIQNDTSSNSIILEPCKGCQLDTVNIPQKCRFNINNDQSTSLFIKKNIQDNKITTRISKHNLSNHLTHSFQPITFNPSLQPIIQIPNINDHLITSNFDDPLLLNLILQFKSFNWPSNIEFLIKTKNKPLNNETIIFNIAILNTPTTFALSSSVSLHLSILHIITFLLTISPNQTSLLFLSKYKRLYDTSKKLTPNKRTNCKIPFLSTIINIQNILQIKSNSFNVSKIPKTLNFFKFPNNPSLPLLTKPIQISHLNIFNHNNISLPPLRHLIKNTHKLFNTVNSLNSNRIFNDFSTNTDNFIHLNTFLKNIPQPTNKEESTLFNFRFKILTNSLPTKTNLHTKYPLLYTNNLCPSCKNQPENFNHILKCPSYTQIFSKLISLTHDTISKLQNEKIDSEKLINCKRS